MLNRFNGVGTLCLCMALVAGCGSETTGGGGTTAVDGGTAVDAADNAGADTGTSGATDAVAADVPTTDAGASDAGAADASGPAPTWATVHAQIIVKNSCAGGYCHGGGSGSLRLTGDATKDHTTLLGGTAGNKDKATCAKGTYVVPGKPAESLLWLKVDKNASHGCGDKMPPGSTDGGLDQADSDLVKAWIAAGAKP